jgi:FtsP/CotA-like multicopper oxidase with cupredoxin domain
MTGASDAEGAVKHLGGRRWALVVLAALVAAGAVGVLVYYHSPPPPSSAGEPSLMQATCSSVKSNATQVEHVASGGSGDHAYFLIVEGDYPDPYAGLNGSAYVPPTTQWPVMKVRLGQVVSIHVINCATSESHGFQISYYDDIQQNGHNNLVAVPPGQSYDVTFTATKAGTFRVYCGILCSIHPLMQNGELIVS